jgi:hypothetical protein
MRAAISLRKLLAHVKACWYGADYRGRIARKEQNTMKPSRTIKGAFREARRAGFTGSLKAWVASLDLAPNSYADQWRRNKLAAKRRRRGGA